MPRRDRSGRGCAPVRRPSAAVEELEGRLLLSSTPFLAAPVSLPGTLYADIFDNGGEGIAYHDTDSVNHGGMYRRTGVDLVNSSAGIAVGWTNPGEWLRYTVNVTQTGSYRLLTRAAVAGAGAVFHVSSDGVNVSGSISVPDTGDWNHFTFISSPDIRLTAGRHVLQFTFDRAGARGACGNFSSMTFAYVGSAQQPSGPAITYKTAAPSPTPRFESAAGVVNNKLYVFGGFYNARIQATSASAVYDLATNTWKPIAPLPEPTTHMGQAVDGSTIWLAGGFVGDNPGTTTAHVWKYNVLTNTYTAGPSLPAPRGAGALVLLGRTLHFFGGLLVHEVDQGEHWTLNIDDPRATWKTAAPLPDARNHLAGVALNGLVYAVGGQHHWDEFTGNDGTVDAYDPATDRWTHVASMPIGHGHIAASTFVYQGHLITMGGAANGTEAVTDVFSYNPQSNTWTRLTPLPLPRRSPVAQLIGNQVVVTTGDPGNVSATVNTWIGTFLGTLP